MLRVFLLLLLVCISIGLSAAQWFGKSIPLHVHNMLNISITRMCLTCSISKLNLLYLYYLLLFTKKFIRII